MNHQKNEFENTNEHDNNITEYGIQKSDLVRVILQALESLNYGKSVEILEKESKIKLHSSEIERFRRYVLDGDWEKVVENLSVLEVSPESDNYKSIQFLIFRQKYLELLENQKTKEALATLRQELAPVTRDAAQLHKLASLVMCTDPMELRKRAKWRGSSVESRQEVIYDIQQYISPNLMVPKDRLQKLLVKAMTSNKIKPPQDQTVEPISLLEEELPSYKQVPQNLLMVLEDHKDEVWYVAFSNNGKYMASCSADKTAIIYNLSFLNQKENRPIICKGHENSVSVVKFSPDSKMLLSCSEDKTLRLWDVDTGECLQIFDKHREGVSSCGWLSDSKEFISGGAGNDKVLRRWNIEGEELDVWRVNFRISDLDVTRDSKRLVVVGQKKIYVFDPFTKTELFSIAESDYITSMCLSPCSRFILCNISREEGSGGKGGIHMWDLEDKLLIKEYSGHVQTKYVLRCCFGGKNNIFVASGSEDCKVFIWDRYTSQTLAELTGHSGSINCVAWSPTDPYLFASASDDNTVRLWTRNQQDPKILK